MKHRGARWRFITASALFVGFNATGWTLVSACSSSTAIAPAAETGAPDQDASPAPEPVDDAGAPDVLGDTVGAPCDPIKQDCVDPTLRCQIIRSGVDFVTGCAPPWEPAKNQEGQVCSRTKPGFDDCVKGFSCLLDGVTATSCHRLCAKDSDCGPGAKCGAITTVPPYYGLCWKTCTPFGTECAASSCAGAHFDNDQQTLFESCREVGAGALGSSCQAQFDCAADMNCQGNSGFTCKAMCDDMHACDGGSCTKSKGLPNDGGICR